jgi:hypothetical protein
VTSQVSVTLEAPAQTELCPTKPRARDFQMNQMPIRPRLKTRADLKGQHGSTRGRNDELAN